MGTLSVWHWLVLLIVFLPPIWKIVAKAGYSGAWSLLFLVPIVNVIMLWVFAFMNWPRNKPGA